jgi:hypothetical protein
MLRSSDSNKFATLDSCNHPAKNQDVVHEEVNKAKAKTPTGYTGTTILHMQIVARVGRSSGSRHHGAAKRNREWVS